MNYRTRSEKRIDLLPEDLQFLINEVTNDCEELVKEERIRNERVERLMTNEMLAVSIHTIYIYMTTHECLNTVDEGIFSAYHTEYYTY